MKIKPCRTINSGPLANAVRRTEEKMVRILCFHVGRLNCDLLAFHAMIEYVDVSSNCPL